MAYFPFFAELSGRTGLIIGGGAVARRKIEHILPYGPQLTVVAPELDPALRELSGLRLIERPFRPEDLDGVDFVLAAAGSREVNRQAAELCHDRRIPVNVMDDQSLCTFIIPSLVKKGSLSVGISTGGSSPTAAIYLKKKFQELVPDRFDEMLDYLCRQREAVKASIPGEARRKKLQQALFAACMERERPLTEEETRQLYEAEERENGHG